MPFATDLTSDIKGAPHAGTDTGIPDGFKVVGFAPDAQGGDTGPGIPDGFRVVGFEPPAPAPAVAPAARTWVFPREAASTMAGTIPELVGGTARALSVDRNSLAYAQQELAGLQAEEQRLKYLDSPQATDDYEGGEPTPARNTPYLLERVQSQIKEQQARVLQKQQPPVPLDAGGQAELAGLRTQAAELQTYMAANPMADPTFSSALAVVQSQIQKLQPDDSDGKAFRAGAGAVADFADSQKKMAQTFYGADPNDLSFTAQAGRATGNVVKLTAAAVAPGVGGMVLGGAQVAS